MEYFTTLRLFSSTHLLLFFSNALHLRQSEQIARQFYVMRVSFLVFVVQGFAYTEHMMWLQLPQSNLTFSFIFFFFSLANNDNEIINKQELLAYSQSSMYNVESSISAERIELWVAYLLTYAFSISIPNSSQHESTQLESTQKTSPCALCMCEHVWKYK